MKIGEMPCPITIGDSCLLQIPSEPFDSWKTVKDRFVRLLVSFDFQHNFYHVSVQAHRRWLAVLGSGGPDLDKRHDGIQMHITPLQRRQFGPAQARMHRHEINRLTIRRDHRQQLAHFLTAERTALAGFPSFSPDFLNPRQRIYLHTPVFDQPVEKAADRFQIIVGRFC